MQKSFFQMLVESGVTDADDYKIRRTVILSNIISLILILANILLFIIIPQNRNSGGFKEMVIGILIFAIPVFLNKVSLRMLSRLFLCWVPPYAIIVLMVFGLKEADFVSVSSYNGVRYYLLAFGCLPFLLMERKKPWWFFIAVIPSLISIVFLDVILDVFGVGFGQKGLVDPGYTFTPLRSFVSYVVITGSCFSLKLIIENSDELNQKLLNEVEEKNALLKMQTKNELSQLNLQLQSKVQESNEREFILNQSQRIAKIGSWEYRVENDFWFWSDGMYDLVGLDKSFHIKTENLNEALGQEGSGQLTNATVNLLETGGSFDITVRTRTPIGYTKWFRVYAYPILEQNKTIGARGICHDVTFFKQAEEKLRAGEAKFSKVFENYPEFIMVVRESDLMVVDVNPKIKNILGFEKQEVLGRSARTMDLFLSEDERQAFIESYMVDGYTDYQCQWKRKDSRIIEVKITGIRIDIDGQYYRMSVVDDITEQKHSEREKEHARYLLNERIKELTTLYGVSEVLRNEQKTNQEMLREVVSILPAGWQYPEITVAKISFGDEAFSTMDFSKALQKQQAEFTVPPHTKGLVEIGYTVEKPQESEGPFFAEERKLIDMIAEMLEKYFTRKIEHESLVEAQANLKATINNTKVMIWSVDREFRLITFNNPFFEHVQEFYGAELRAGDKALNELDKPEAIEQKLKWTENYSIALSGKLVTMEENRFGMDFSYSLSPIIENNLIIGVSVFADNITERKRQDRELGEANKKIGELKLMALRSVMSPHFIFNVLNSIQFFIAKNDRLNAITYLSTFSKLIRSILTHSVNNKIRLVDEIEMLKNYVNLEMVRFENKINFVLKVHPDVDIESIEIPSLLIQPYVENAILHGLYNKPDGGTLLIDIYEENDVVFFQIEDNGIGREAALKLRDQNFPTHKSMGIKITEERLQLINQKNNVAFEIHDLMNEGQPSGTRVRIGVIC
jgi:PAS domain S-box-containing protein